MVKVTFEVNEIVRKIFLKIEEIIKYLKSRYTANFRQDSPTYWRVEVMTTEGRSQVVHLIYKKIILAGQDLSRLIAESPIGPLYKHFNYETILRKNAELDVGAICIEDLKNEENLFVSYLTLRSTHLVPTADYEEIQELIEKTAFVADQLEKEIYARDYH
ncbi:MAG: hypothetical protein ACHQQQ_01770 [Bacteroidota bacterium]